jgi:uncharacterized membrane protein
MTADQSANSSPPHAASNSYESTAGLVTARWLAAVFVLYGLTATALLAVTMPPFQVADEQNHFLRAAQIADGTLIGTRALEIGTDGAPQTTAGGPVDPAIKQAFAAFDPIRWHPDVRAKRSDWATDVHWSNARAFADFPNTALYPPFFYLPSVIGIWAGRKAELSVVQTLTVARLLTGLTAVALGAVAIVIAGGGGAWIFAVLTLPMSLSLMASTSQDALLLACSAMAGALLARASRQPNMQEGKVLALLSMLLSLIAMMRPPYVALAVLPLGLTKVAWRWRIAAAVVIIACAATWFLIVAANTWTNIFAVQWKSDAPAQLARLRGDPIFAVHVTVATLQQYWRDYFKTFVGVLGWLDTPLPSGYYTAAGPMLFIAAAATSLGLTGKRIRILSVLLVPTGLLLSAAGVLAMIYVLGNAPGSQTAGGVQGRYFLPLALAGTAMLPALGNSPAARLHKPLVVLVAAFPIVSLAVVMQAILLRYYLV